MREKNTMPLNFDLGKLPPSVIEFEESVIGAVLLEKEAIFSVISILKSDNFYKEEHQKIWDSIVLLFSNGKPIDLLTVKTQLQKSKELEMIGGPVYLTGLVSRVGSSAHIVEHARQIKDKYFAREIIKISQNSMDMGFDGSIDVADTIDYIQTEIFKLHNSNSEGEIEHLATISARRMKEFEEMSKSDENMQGVPSGFRKADNLTSGWQKGDFIVIGARPSMGKTALMLQLAKNAAAKKYPVGIFSIEMTKTQLHDRILSGETGIENGFFKTGDFTQHDWQRMETATRYFEDLNIYIDDSAKLTVVDLRAKSLRMKMEFGVQLIIIDYLQLMSTVKPLGNREAEISDISKKLKAIAKELQIPIIALSQLSRAVESRQDKTPQLSDLRESGSIEQDADIVLFILRYEYYKITELEDGTSTKYMIQIIFAKHRNGPIQDFRLWRSKNWSQIYEQMDLPDGPEFSETTLFVPIDNKSKSANDNSFDDTPF